MKEKRNYNQQIIWTGDLNDDCTARWSGLMLRAEWMDDDDWWWCVYDMLDDEKQIGSSNENNNIFKSGEKARKKAEEVAQNYLKNELIDNLKGLDKEIDFDQFILDLKNIGISSIQTIIVLIKEFGFNYTDAKNIVFDSPVWEGLREQSEMLTQSFLDYGANIADKVEYYEDGHVKSLTYVLKEGNKKIELKKNNNKKRKSNFWKRFLSKFKL